MLVSVIIPCHNVSQYIRECLESVLNQLHSNLEIICVDNCSTDETWNILMDLQRQFPAIILEKEIRPGAPAVRNKGLERARGEWVQFLDADDLLLPEKILRQVSIVNDVNTEIAFVAGAYKRLSLDGRETIFDRIDPDPFTTLFHNQAGITSSNLWKREILTELGGWDESLKSSQEAELMMRIVLSGRTYLGDPEVLTIVRERNSGQISQTDPVGRWVRYLTLYANFTGAIRTRFPLEYKKNQVFYFESLLFSVLTLAQYDLAEARSLYKKMMKPYAPSKPEWTVRYWWCKTVQFAGLTIWSKIVMPLNNMVRRNLKGT